MKQKNAVLMVVAVGCGLVAAILTSQMSAKSTSDQIEVWVASKDLPVGTMLAKDDLKDEVVVKKVKRSKDGLPPAYVVDKNDLLDKRVSRPVREGETFNPADLTKGGVITLPAGMHMVSLQVGGASAVSGFVGPGSKVDVLATIQLNNKLIAFPLMVDMLVVAVDTQTAYTKEGVFPSTSTVSFAVDREQALLLELAKRKGCNLSLMLRHPDAKKEIDATYDVKKVIKLLQDDQGANPLEDAGGNDRIIPNPKSTKPETTPEVVKVPVAKESIAAGTEITNDLIADKFSTIELPKPLAENAVADLTTKLGKTLTTGLGKGQWVTESLVGDAMAKAPPVTPFVPPKDDEPKTPMTPLSRRPTHDLVIHSASGSRVFRYEEVKPGQWKMTGEVSPTDQRNAEPPPAAPKSPETQPDADKKETQPDADKKTD